MSVKEASKQKERRLITSALPYVNNLPHLGNVVGSVLSGDVFNRYSKLRGHETVFVCGTDEYGTASEVSAIKNNVTPEELCRVNHAEHKKIYTWFEIEFDNFGRTSVGQHKDVTQRLFLEMWNNGHFTKETEQRPYCLTCSLFLADRYIQGTCTHCRSPNARGDQCDDCGMVLHLSEIEAPRCWTCGHAPEIRDTEHLFYHLESFQDSISQFIEKNSPDWTPSATQIANDWKRREFVSRCMTRDLKFKWGVPVPVEGMEDKVFYVWFDAPIGYITFTEEIGKGSWWIEDAERPTSLYQFMGKDNVFFHSVFFPSMLLGLNNKHLLPKIISSTGYVTYEGGKFSKSHGRGVFGQDLLEDQIGPSGVWRFHLMKSRPESGDSDFSWHDFQNTLNSFLINTIGNLCNRVLSFAKSRMGGRASAVDASLLSFKELKAELDKRIAEYNEAMDRTEIRTGAQKIIEVAKAGNTYLQQAFLKGKHCSLEEKAGFVSASLSILVLLSQLLSPFTPLEAERLRKMLAFEGALLIPDEFLVTVSEGHEISSDISLLFTRLTDKQMAAVEGQIEKAFPQCKD